MIFLAVVSAFLLFWFCFWFISSTLWGVDSERYALIVGWTGFILVVPAAMFGVAASFVWS